MLRILQAFFLMLSTTSFTLPKELGHQALVPIQKPDSSICKPWTQLKNLSPDLAQCGLLYDLGNFGNLEAFPLNNGPSVLLSTLENVDRLPEWHKSIPAIAVYLVKAEWFLIHANSGWYWLYCPINTLEKQYPTEYNKNQIIDWQGKPNNVLDYIYDTAFHKSDDWIEYNKIMRIQPVENEHLRAVPSLSGQDLGPVKGEYLRFLAFDGDWVKVQEPVQIRWRSTSPDRSDVLNVKWNSKRVGWIRWRIPGPIPGAYHQLFRGMQFFGTID